MNKPSQRKSLAAARPVREPAWAAAGGPNRRPPRRANVLKISQSLYCRNYSAPGFQIDSSSRGHAGQAAFSRRRRQRLLCCTAYTDAGGGDRRYRQRPRSQKVKVGVSSTRHLRGPQCDGKGVVARDRSASLAKGRRQNWCLREEDSKGTCKEFPRWRRPRVALRRAWPAATAGAWPFRYRRRRSTRLHASTAAVPESSVRMG